jgi:DNA fragmentation factor alpha subunit
LTARTLFGAGSDELKIVLEEDGTEVIEDDYLQMLDNNTKLMVLKNIEEWAAPFLACYDETDTSQAHRHNPVKILQKLHRSPGSIALLSEEELEVIISVAKSQVQNIGIPESEVDCLKDACERELDQKRRVRDALDQFNLYHKAVEPQHK